MGLFFGESMNISTSQLARILERSEEKVTDWQPPINAAMERYGIDTPLRVAAFLSQIGHESGRLRYTHEIWNPVQCPWQSRYDTHPGLGNTRPEAIHIAADHGFKPGEWWKGHGLIQITGYDNHLACSKELGLDLLNHPELLEQHQNAAKSAAWFWYEHNCNKYADIDDIDGVSDVINIGHKTEKIGDSNGYSDRISIYRRAKLILLEQV